MSGTVYYNQARKISEIGYHLIIPYDGKKNLYDGFEKT
jgi:hypothetical protein